MSAVVLDHDHPLVVDKISNRDEAAVFVENPDIGTRDWQACVDDDSAHSRLLGRSSLGVDEGENSTSELEAGQPPHSPDDTRCFLNRHQACPHRRVPKRQCIGKAPRSGAIRKSARRRCQSSSIENHNLIRMEDPPIHMTEVSLRLPGSRGNYSNYLFHSAPIRDGKTPKPRGRHFSEHRGAWQRQNRSVAASFKGVLILRESYPPSRRNVRALTADWPTSCVLCT